MGIKAAVSLAFSGAHSPYYLEKYYDIPIILSTEFVPRTLEQAGAMIISAKSFDDRRITRIGNDYLVDEGIKVIITPREKLDEFQAFWKMVCKMTAYGFWSFSMVGVGGSLYGLVKIRSWKGKTVLALSLLAFYAARRALDNFDIANACLTKAYSTETEVLQFASVRSQRFWRSPLPMFFYLGRNFVPSIKYIHPQEVVWYFVELFKELRSGSKPEDPLQKGIWVRNFLKTGAKYFDLERNLDDWPLKNRFAEACEIFSRLSELRQRQMTESGFAQFLSLSIIMGDRVRNIKRIGKYHADHTISSDISCIDNKNLKMFKKLAIKTLFAIQPYSPEIRQELLKAERYARSNDDVFYDFATQFLEAALDPERPMPPMPLEFPFRRMVLPEIPSFKFLTVENLNQFLDVIHKTKFERETQEHFERFLNCLAKVVRGYEQTS